MKTSRLALAVLSTAAIGISSIAVAQTIPPSTVNPAKTAPHNAPVNGTNGAPSTVNLNSPNNSDEGTTGRTAGMAKPRTAVMEKPMRKSSTSTSSDTDSSMATERAPKPARH